MSDLRDVSVRDDATLENYEVVDSRTGARSAVTGHRVGDFAVRFAKMMDVCVGDGEWITVSCARVVDHLPSGSSTVVADERTAWFVADECAVHLDGIKSREELKDRSILMCPWFFAAVMGKSTIGYRTWLREQDLEQGG